MRVVVVVHAVVYRCDMQLVGGFYSTLMFPGVRLVSVNTQYGDVLNFWLYAGNGTGGPDQIKWLSATLQAARQNGELVLLA